VSSSNVVERSPRIHGYFFREGHPPGVEFPQLSDFMAEKIALLPCPFEIAKSMRHSILCAGCLSVRTNRSTPLFLTFHACLRSLCSSARMCLKQGSGWLSAGQKLPSTPWPAHGRMFSSPLSGPPSSRAANRAKVERAEIMSMAEYEKVRKDLTSKYRAPAKKLRRVEIGPR
jgi:hypothetical protein